MIIKLREKIYSKIAEIKDEGIRRFVTCAFNNSDEDFWYSPSSSSGRYHPPENNIEGGLIIHLLKAFEVGKILCDYYKVNEKDTDIILAGILLHDIKKFGNPWGKFTDYAHGKIASDWLDKFELKEPEKTEIKDCVRYHMNQYTIVGDMDRARNCSFKERVVQMSDVFSALKEASWFPGIQLNLEDIEKVL